MRTILIICFTLWGVVSVAHAQDNQTVTINPDGTITISNPTAVTPPPAQESAPAPVKKEPVVKEDRPAPPPVATKEEKVMVPATDIAPPKKPAAPKKKQAVKKAAKPSSKPVPEKVREPAAPDSIGRSDPAYIPEARPRGPITPDEAKRIAIDEAPPAISVDVYPADYNGRKVFQVIFKTENGDRYVLVDRQTGEIVRN